MENGIKTYSDKSEYIQKPPEYLGGILLKDLRDWYKQELFERYLPFWEKGSINNNGAVRCELNDEGIVQEDRVEIWYQSRALWVYSFLYNNFGEDQSFFEKAKQIKSFLLNKMYRPELGGFYEVVNSSGEILVEQGEYCYGWLFAAEGLAEFAKASRDISLKKLAIDTIKKALNWYDQKDYTGTGYRSQGHSMVLIRIISQFLDHHKDVYLEQILNEQISLVMNRFYYREYGISNEWLDHNFERLEEKSSYSHLGHSTEILWMIMFEGRRSKDTRLFTWAKERFYHFLELGWDSQYEGFCGEFSLDSGPDTSMKLMWTHAELLIACITILEECGEVRAKEWYDKIFPYGTKRFSVGGTVVRYQACNRKGEKMERPSTESQSISSFRKGNYHQVREYMLNLLALERMVQKQAE